MDGSAGHPTRIVDAFTVAFYGLPKNADAAARSMLRLLLPLLGDRWRLGESDFSDVLFLEPDALAELHGAGSAKGGTLYIVFADDRLPPPGAFATVQRPLNSAQLVELLHMAQAELEKRGGQLDNTTVALTIGASADKPDGERRIRTSMRIAARWALQDKSRAITVQDLKQTKIFSMLPGMGFTTRLRSTELADLIRANQPVDVIDLNEKEKRILRDGHKFASPKKLEWIYWLTGSNGEIRPELKVSRHYQLRKYPDFAKLPHFRADVRMASLLKAEPMTVGDLAQRANARLETACNFVNACWALGYLGDPLPGSSSAASSAKKARVKKETEVEETGGLMAPLRKLGLFRRK